MAIYSAGSRRRSRIRVVRRTESNIRPVDRQPTTTDTIELEEAVEQIRLRAFALYESVRAVQREVERGRVGVMPQLGDLAQAAAAVSEDISLLRLSASFGRDDDGIFAVPI